MEVKIESVGGFFDAIFDPRLLIITEEISLLPFVGLFADMDDLRRNDMPALGAPSVVNRRRILPLDLEWAPWGGQESGG